MRKQNILTYIFFLMTLAAVSCGSGGDSKSTLVFDRAAFEHERQLWMAGGLGGPHALYSYRLLYLEPDVPTAIYIQVSSGYIAACRQLGSWGDFSPLDVSSLSELGMSWLQNITFTGVYSKIEELANQGNCKIDVSYSFMSYPEKVFYQSFDSSSRSFNLYMDILVP